MTIVSPSSLQFDFRTLLSPLCQWACRMRGKRQTPRQHERECETALESAAHRDKTIPHQHARNFPISLSNDSLFCFLHTWHLLHMCTHLTTLEYFACQPFNKRIRAQGSMRNARKHACGNTTTTCFPSVPGHTSPAQLSSIVEWTRTVEWDCFHKYQDWRSSDYGLCQRWVRIPALFVLTFRSSRTNFSEIRCTKFIFHLFCIGKFLARSPPMVWEQLLAKLGLSHVSKCTHGIESIVWFMPQLITLLISLSIRWFILFCDCVNTFCSLLFLTCLCLDGPGHHHFTFWMTIGSWRARFVGLIVPHCHSSKHSKQRPSLSFFQTFKATLTVSLFVFVSLSGINFPRDSLFLAAAQDTPPSNQIHSHKIHQYPLNHFSTNSMSSVARRNDNYFTTTWQCFLAPSRCTIRFSTASQWIAATNVVHQG